jgi:HAD superfamily hydrolase (TIGR01509 family)
MKTLVLDAMGVIFAAGDDVVELLCPFVHEHGGVADDGQIEALYNDASLGRISARRFWEAVQVDPTLEDSYLRRHRLSIGLREFLRDAKPRVNSIWCLSNDVSEWSRKLRDFYDLHAHFKGFVISGDIGVRKPDATIYRELISQTGVPAENMVLVDDRPKNLDAATALGFQTVQFGDSTAKTSRHFTATDFSQVLEMI